MTTTIRERPRSSPLTAPQSQAEGIGLLVAAVVGGIALWRAFGAGSGDGTGSSTRVAGSLGQVSVATMVPQGTHGTVKEIGASSIFVSYNWTARTKDRNGNAIDWPYQVITRMGHNASGGWQQATGQLGVSQTSLRVRTRGTQIRKTLFSVPQDPQSVWDIRVWLFGLRSDADGLPVGDPTQEISGSQTLGAQVQDVGDWQGLAYAAHAGAVIAIPVNNSASVEGGLSAVTVAQPRRRIGSLQRAG